MIHTFFVFSLGLTVSMNLWASPEKVFPEETSSNTKTIRGAHLVFDNKIDNPSQYLLVSVGGTGSYPKALQAFDSVAEESGLQALAIDYPNAVISTICRKNPSEGCFNNFRNEIVFGESTSQWTEVDVDNSLVHRIESLAKFQLEKEPRRWERFFKDGELDWSRLILVGHSQGSGNVAYLAKFKAVQAVILLGGPQDSDENGVADWTSEPGATPGDRHFALLHKDDYFDSSVQTQVITSLLQGEPPSVIELELEAPGTESVHHILLSTAPVDDAHNAILRPEFSQLWGYLIHKALAVQ